MAREPAGYASRAAALRGARLVDLLKRDAHGFVLAQIAMAREELLIRAPVASLPASQQAGVD
jgi:hypothetical protein